MTPEPDARHVGVPRQRLKATDDSRLESDPAAQSLPAAVDPLFQDARDRESLKRRAGLPTQTVRQPPEAYDPRIHGEELPDDEQDDATARADSSVAWWRDVLFNPALISITMLLGVILLLMLVNEVFQFIQAVHSAPRPLQWIGYAFVTMLTAAAAWAAIRLMRCITALRVTPQIQRSDYYAARHRPFVRQTAKLKSREGRDILRAILAEYPLEEPRFQKLLSSCGCTQESRSRLRGDIRELLSVDDLSAESWLSRVDMRVLALMDDCAKKRVHDYALQVGLKTALMPTSMADMLIVVTNSLLMLKDLCALYNVRTTPLATCSLAGHLFMNAFVAARLEGQLSSLTQEADSALRNAFTAPTTAGDAANAAGTAGVAVGSLGKIVTTATRGAGRRFAEGGANYILVRRLGDACIRYLRPIQH
jgi:uncharacterized membrane protein YcjF (UPF0283 family)